MYVLHYIKSMDRNLAFSRLRAMEGTSCTKTCMQVLKVLQVGQNDSNILTLKKIREINTYFVLAGIVVENIT
jgi:hypothetical protein